ncbi:MAG: HEPN domain-containing protein [Chloroflexia bacterium]|nr:HEPN domain-containing protein [Chloroflexia bacterium]
MADDTAVNSYPAKARASLAGAESGLAIGRFDNSVNRSYYACYQAAVAALVTDRIVPRSQSGRWEHEAVSAQFNGQLIARRKRFPPELRGTLDRLMALRQTADYETKQVTETQADRALRQARTFVNTVGAGGKRQ